METNTTKEQALVEVKANLDMESYKKYYWFFMVRNPWFWIVWSMPLLIALPSLLSYFSWTSFITSGVLFLYMAILFAMGSRLSYKQQSKLNTESDLIYAFYREDYQITHIGHLSTGIQTNRYEFIKIAYETKHAFYLRTIDKSRAMYVLDKKYLAPEQIEALRTLFAQRFGEKFKGLKAKKREA